MRKTVLCLLLVLLLLPVRVSAGTTDPEEFDLKSLAEDTVYLTSVEDPFESILGLERNADAKRYPASTTKIMTCILALENCAPDEIVKVGKRATNLNERNSKMGLKEGESYQMIDLLYGLMLPSGNDAAIAIAEHVGGSVAKFAEMMNAKAEELGMTDSHFVNPHGLHSDQHYTTARDLAVLAAYAMENETFAKIVSTTEYTATSTDGRVIRLQSSNRLLRDATAETYTPYSCLYADAIGIKTGDTNSAGKCLVAAARRNGTTYLLVLLNGKQSPSSATGLEKDKYSAQRFYDAAALFDYAFSHDVVTVDVNDMIDRLPETYAISPDPSLSFATEALYRIEWDRSATLTLPRYEADALNADPIPEDLLSYWIGNFNAEIGTEAGTVTVSLNGQTLFTGALIAEEYTYPPTPAPTDAPTYAVEEDTPAPTPETVVPIPPSSAPLSEQPAASPVMIPIESKPSEPDPWYLNLFRCSGCGQS